MTEEEFWNARKGLELVRDWARARRVAPWALLGEVLARVLCRTPPAVQLPPLVGGRGSLNCLFAAVGPSGQGKGAAGQTARDAIDLGGLVDIVPIGSGEGLAKTFGAGSRDKETGDFEVTRTRYSALLQAREIDTWAALKDRSGSTLIPELRKLYSGEELGFGYADPDKRVIIPDHEYRACLIAGVQPGRGEVLLADADGGTPQRFCWLPAVDRDAPDKALAEPAQIAWEPPPQIARIAMEDTRPYEFEVCDEAREVIDNARLARLRGDGNALDGHSLFTRLKVAAGLALFDARVGVNDEDWTLAGVIMAVSDRTRETVADQLREAAARENEARGHAEARRAQIVGNQLEADMIAKATNRIVGVLAEHRDWMAHAPLRRTITMRQREFFEDAIDSMLRHGQIEHRDTSKKSEGHGGEGREYRLIDRHPGHPGHPGADQRKQASPRPVTPAAAVTPAELGPEHNRTSNRGDAQIRTTNRGDGETAAGVTDKTAGQTRGDRGDRGDATETHKPPTRTPPPTRGGTAPSPFV